MAREKLKRVEAQIPPLPRALPTHPTPLADISNDRRSALKNILLFYYSSDMLLKERLCHLAKLKHSNIGPVTEKNSNTFIPNDTVNTSNMPFNAIHLTHIGHRVYYNR